MEWEGQKFFRRNTEPWGNMQRGAGEEPREALGVSETEAINPGASTPPYSLALDSAATIADRKTQKSIFQNRD